MTIGGTIPDELALPAWAHDGGAGLRSAATAARTLAGELCATGGCLRGLFADTLNALGWQGMGAARASAWGQEQGGQLERATGELDMAEQALLALALAVEEQVSVWRADAARRVGLAGEWGSGPGGQAGPFAQPAQDRQAQELAAADARLQACLDALAAADRRATAVLQDVAAQVSVLARGAAQAGWLRDQVPGPGDAAQLLTAAGLLDTPAEAGILAAAEGLSDSPADTEQVRARLADLPVEELAAFLERHPDLARRLLTAPAPDPAALALGSATSGQTGADQAGLVQLLGVREPSVRDRTAAVAAYFARLGGPDPAAGAAVPGAGGEPGRGAVVGSGGREPGEDCRRAG